MACSACDHLEGTMRAGHEKAVYKVGEIIIEGNTKTADRVIREQLDLYPGQYLSFWRLWLAEWRLTTLGIFEFNLEKGIRPRVRVSPETPPGCDYLDILVEVTEKK
jgi:outer membrane protein assembly factor BamA